MEKKAELLKPYTDEQRIKFIVENNHKKGYTIEESATSLVALGETEAEKQAKEQERIQELFMSKSDFFDGTIKAFGADKNDLQPAITAILESLPISDIEKKVALNNFENAQNYYRKHSLFTLLSDVEIPITETLTIEISSKQWDRFFDETSKGNKDAYKELLAM